MKPVTIPDDFTGKEFTCPSCSNAFDVPAKYNPAVLSDTVRIPHDDLQAAINSTQTPDQAAQPATADHPPGGSPAPSPPPSVPVAPPPHFGPPPVPAPSVAQPTVAGYTKSVGFAFSPKVVGWLPVIFLTILFITTFFSWIGSYLGGSSAYWQSPWRAIGGWVGKNPILAQSMPGSGDWVDKTPSDWALMLPFLLCVIVALLLAWADREISWLDPRRVQKLAQIWDWRKIAVVGLSSAALFFILIQVINGFGMERAIRKMVHDDPELVDLRDKAKDARAKDAVAIKEESALAKYNLDRTIWQDLGLTCNVLAILTMLLSIQLDRRGDKPPPRLVLHY
jgi:hypothetical protein